MSNEIMKYSSQPNNQALCKLIALGLDSLMAIVSCVWDKGMNEVALTSEELK